VKEHALTHLQLLRAQEDCKHIDMAVDEYQRQFGRRPALMSELVLSGLLLGEPVDPLGYPYALSETGKAEISAESPLKKKSIKTPGSK
jgi:hypothetical protein